MDFSWVLLQLCFGTLCILQIDARRQPLEKRAPKMESVLKPQDSLVCALRSPMLSLGGNVIINQEDKGTIRINGFISGLPPGKHGFHIHNNGFCSDPGDHYNPGNSLHGGPTNTVDKRHLGDLGNIARNNGQKDADFTMQVSGVPLDDIIGRAILITADPDDLGKGSGTFTSTTGNSGKAIACCVLGIMRPPNSDIAQPKQ